MKTIRIILIAAFLVTLCAFSGQTVAQEKSKEEKEKELKMAEEINQQKREIEKLKAEQEAAMFEQQKAVEEAMKEAQQQVEAVSKYKDQVRVYRGTGDRALFNGEPFVFTPGVEGFNWYSHSSDDERTSWDFSKSVKETTFSRDYTFDVETTINSVEMSVNGDCKAGEIRIKIVMPNGKTYSDIVIDEFGNLNWRKSFNISETENKDKTGAWTFEIKSSKASGFFKISLQTY